MKKKTKDINSILLEKEPEANKSIALIYILISGLLMLGWAIMQTGYYIVNTTLCNFALLGDGFLFLIFGLICLIFKGRPKWIKYGFMTIALIAALLINMMTGYKTWLLFALPIVVSCRYFSRLLTGVIGGLSSVLVLASAYINAYILPQYFQSIDINTVIYDKYTVLTTEGSLYRAIMASTLEPDLIFENTLVLYTVQTIITILVITFAGISVVKYGQSVMYEENMRARNEAEMEIELEQDKQKIMMSQIQPHFLYNCLSTIMAIDNNPPETIEALGEFGKYLRGNLDSLTSEELIPFSKELQHVKRYISLEQLRFKDNLKIEYNIEAVDFLIPVMTVQMLSENAIKHGITVKEDGGTLKISSLDCDSEYQVIIEDDGAGFDENNISKDRNHVGLNSTKTRIKELCSGNLEIDSKIGSGTKITIHIPKGEQQ